MRRNVRSMQGYDGRSGGGRHRTPAARTQATAAIPASTTARAYADAVASGQYRRDDGSYANYDLEHLGLAFAGWLRARAAGKAATTLQLSYDGQPTRLYDTGVTPFSGAGARPVGLPANWVRGRQHGRHERSSAPSLRPVRHRVRPPHVGAAGPLLRESQLDGIRGISSPGERRHRPHQRQLPDARRVQLPQPIDYVTNSFEAAPPGPVAGRALRLTYTGSWFEDNSDSLTFANPYLPIVPGSTAGTPRAAAEQRLCSSSRPRAMCSCRGSRRP